MYRFISIELTLTSVTQAKKGELGIAQKGLAAMLGMGEAKLSQILNGKRAPGVSFLKSLHEKLGIDGNFIPERV